MIKLGEGCLKQPVDITVDKDGIIYTTTRDGWIIKIRKNGTCEDWKFAGGDTLLGVTMSTKNAGDVLVCDYWNISDIDKVSYLTSLALVKDFF